MSAQHTDDRDPAALRRFAIGLLEETDPLVLLAATTAAYLAAAGEAASALAFRLTVLAVVAGPLFGLAGAAVHHGPGGRQLSVLALLAAVVGQAVVLTLIGPVPGGAGY